MSNEKQVEKNPSEKLAEVKKEEHQEHSTATGMFQGIKNAFGAAYDKVSGVYASNYEDVNNPLNPKK